MKRAALILLVLLLLASSGGGQTNISQPSPANVTQIAGTVASTGNGTSNAGDLRVNIASDNSAIANWGLGSTGAAVPSGAQLTGARAATANPSNATGGNLVAAMADKAGRLVVTLNHARDLVTQNTLTVSTTTETTLLSAGGAGVFVDLAYLSCSNTSATATRLDLRDATAGTVRLSRQLPASGGQFDMAFTTPVTQTTANNNWTVQLSAAVTDVRCFAQAIKNQ